MDSVKVKDLRLLLLFLIPLSTDELWWDPAKQNNLTENYKNRHVCAEALKQAFLMLE